MSGWLRRVLGFAAIGAAICLLHIGSVRLGGEVGRLVADNRLNDRDVYAYFYSEVCDVDEFLDDEHGLYGRDAVMEAVHGQ